MSDLESLNYDSISDLSTDEALEVLRQIRLSRRVPLRKTKTTRKVTQKKVTNVDPTTMTAEQIADLLKTLGG